MSIFVRLAFFVSDVIHYIILGCIAVKDTVDDVLHRYKFEVGDWLHAENTVVKIMGIGWKTYDIRVYCKQGVFRYTATQKIAEKAYKKIDKDHFRAIATIYDR